MTRIMLELPDHEAAELFMMARERLSPVRRPRISVLQNPPAAPELQHRHRANECELLHLQTRQLEQGSPA
jgi:hypothetical protein